jgi:hypothetical protein
MPPIPEIMVRGLANCFSGWNIRDRYVRERGKDETPGLVGHYVQGTTPHSGVKSGLRKPTYAIQVT